MRTHTLNAHWQIQTDRPGFLIQAIRERIFADARDHFGRRLLPPGAATPAFFEEALQPIQSALLRDTGLVPVVTASGAGFYIAGMMPRRIHRYLVSLGNYPNLERFEDFLQFIRDSETSRLSGQAVKIIVDAAGLNGDLLARSFYLAHELSHYLQVVFLLPSEQGLLLSSLTNIDKIDVLNFPPLDGISLTVNLELGSLKERVIIIGALVSLYIGIGEYGDFRAGLAQLNSDAKWLYSVATKTSQIANASEIVGLESLEVQTNKLMLEFGHLAEDMKAHAISPEEFRGRVSELLQRFPEAEARPVKALLQSDFLQPRQPSIHQDTMTIHEVGILPPEDRRRRKRP
jgi:hypothetical protein